jgi:phosphatidylserine synthase
MNTLYLAGLYVVYFVSSQEFQRSQPWVQWLGKRLSVIHKDIWTGSRLVAPIILIYFIQDPYLRILAFLGFSLTDWVDGLVAWIKGFGSNWWGDFFDGLVDKVYSQALLWGFGLAFINLWALISMLIIEFGGYFLILVIKICRVFGKGESCIKAAWQTNFRQASDLFLQKSAQVFKNQNGEDSIYKHLKVGKYKFVLQNILILMVMLADFYPQWDWWTFILNVLVVFINLLAFFSVACKIQPRFMGYFANFVTSGSIACAIVAASIAKNHLVFAATLILMSAIIDSVDGKISHLFKDYMERQFGIRPGSTFGILLDSLADLIAFGICTGIVITWMGVGKSYAIFYVLCTVLRLVYFTWIELKHISLGIKEPEARFFLGFPSPAAALCVVSFALWNHVPAVSILNFLTLACGLAEIFFVLRWFHFDNIFRLPKSILLILIAYVLASILIGRIGEGVTLLIVVYSILFLCPVATRIWNSRLKKE